MTRRSFWNLATIGVALLALSLAGGCDDDDDDDDGAGGTAGTGGGGGVGGEGGEDGEGGEGGEGGGVGGDARVRVLHLVPSAPAVDVFLDEDTTAAVEELSFPEGTGYLDVPAGEHTVTVTQTAMPEEAPLVDAAPIELAGGTSYTAVAYDEIATMELALVEDETDDIPAGQARVRFGHFARDLPEAGIDLFDLTGGGQGTEIVSDLLYGETSDSLDLTAQAYVFAIDADDDPSSGFEYSYEVAALPADELTNLHFVQTDPGVITLIRQNPDGTTEAIAPTE